ncbi:alpha/beta hydrolase [Catenuloplanes atrovinosus]|uniref:Pimeloyl-ACP methyl ester carboxylesterase n=1 Tax=Catenuloplanes atrovinosus TaxID=137266 RepID=A0AAE3YKR3_9ACTN|nr:alpha/beta hydrolase [Catenuloplanes atrovinosus]MDR7274209.1 pimeloyl-ACP methyl ester carboxylesterase [Catenuloplanes atrovinosus]
MTRHLSKRRRLAAVVLTGLTAIAATAVGTAYAGTTPDQSRFHRQKLTWQACPSGDLPLDCTRVTVPVDWAAPDGATLTLKVTRHRATGTRRGSLLINPGGPGGSGAGFTERAAAAFGEKTLAAYDVVGWDPRGVGESSPLTCPASANADYWNARLPTTVAERVEFERITANWAAACRAESGPLFDHVDTISTVRDLDVLRAVLGDRKLSYIGMSYGTRIGIFYADLFPGRVGRMVLDAATDPASDGADFWRGTSLAAGRGFDDYLAGCADREGCPLADRTAAQARADVGRLLSTPGPAQDYLATVAAYLVKSPENWVNLDGFLSEALNGEVVPENAEPDIANAAINCMDLPDHRTAAQVMADTARDVADRPVFGHMMMASTLCPQWPVAATGRPHHVTARGAAPILVVGATRDTATPYEWAVSTAQHLANGRLLTRDGTGHVAYPRTPCVTEAVDGYLVDGALPPAGTVCAG